MRHPAPVAAFVLAVALAAAPAAAQGVVVFDVRVPATTPPDAPVWVSGDHAALGSWSGAGVRLRPAGPRRYVGEVALAAGVAIEFKVTRGTWDTVEKDAGGGEIANRRATAGSGRDTLRFEVAAWRDQVGPAAGPRRSTVTGTLRRHPVEALGEVAAREILVWLPPGYDATAATRYPVVYFHDGQNVFDASTSFIGVEWAADETAERLIGAGEVPAFIAVAVPNDGARRSWEYTPAPEKTRAGGGAEGYAQFLIQRVKPLVDSLYATRPDPGSTATVGSSLGGIVAAYLSIAHPGTFGLAGALSPAAWWAGRDIVRRAAAQAKPGIRLWIDIGTREGGMAGWQDAVADARALRDALAARGIVAPGDLVLVVAEGAEHNERAWAARLPDVLRFLLAGRVPPGAR